MGLADLRQPLFVGMRRLLSQHARIQGFLRLLSLNVNRLLERRESAHYVNATGRPHLKLRRYLVGLINHRLPTNCQGLIDFLNEVSFRSGDGRLTSDEFG